MKSPFKFLDSYTKNDKDIFFGRDKEVEALYQRVFESKLLLVYGISGTGKSSLIHCGLANKFHETDWLPIVIRRGVNIIESTITGIKAASITSQLNKFLSPSDFKKGVRSLYLDYFKPVYFIFDQFEELFIFGSKNERREFIQIVKSLIESDLQCRLIFVMREEYMAGVTEFEKYIPTFFSNRVRIEKMSHSNALEAIKEPCKVFNINLEDGFAEALLEKLSPGCNDVELTYLQVFLDKVFRIAQDEIKSQNNQQRLTFTIITLNKIGNVSDLLGSFLDEQISLLNDPPIGLSILKCFVSLKGTRKQISEVEILDTSKTFGNDIPMNILREYLYQFINLRILKEKSEEGLFELRHDALAEKIYGKISMIEKELLEVMNFLDTAYYQFEKRGAFLSESDLKYIQYFDNKQIFKNNKRFSKLIDTSKKYHSKEKRKRTQIVASLAIALIIILGTLSIWAINQRGKAISQKNIAEVQKNEALFAKQEAQKAKAEAEIQRTKAILSESVANKEKAKALLSESLANKEKIKALNAKKIAEDELYKNIKNTLTISAEYMNTLYYRIKNPVSISVSGIPSDKLKVSVKNGTITKINNKYFVEPIKLYETFYENGRSLLRSAIEEITVCTINDEGKLDTIGSRLFQIKAIPEPKAFFAGKDGGFIPRATAVSQIGVFVLSGGEFDNKDYQISSFILSTTRDSVLIRLPSHSYLFTDDQKQLLSDIKRGDTFTITDIYVISSDSIKKQLSNMIFTIGWPDNE